MNINLNFTEKQITILDNCNLQELMKTINTLDIDLKEWTIVSGTTYQEFKIPTDIFKDNKFKPDWTYRPWDQPYYTSTTNTNLNGDNQELLKS